MKAAGTNLQRGGRHFLESALCAFRNERSTSGPQISCLKVGKMPIFIKTVVLRCFFFSNLSAVTSLLPSIDTDEVAVAKNS